jgi:Na+/melibiose symporter-like transporter
MTGCKIPCSHQPIQAPASALPATHVLIGPVSAAVLLLSLLAVRAYPITRDKHGAIRAELAKRKAASLYSGSGRLALI